MSFRRIRVRSVSRLSYELPVGGFFLDKLVVLDELELGTDAASLADDVPLSDDLCLAASRSGDRSGDRSGEIAGDPIASTFSRSGLSMIPRRCDAFARLARITRLARFGSNGASSLTPWRFVVSGSPPISLADDRSRRAASDTICCWPMTRLCSAAAAARPVFRPITDLIKSI